MDTRTFESNLTTWLRHNSGLEQSRNYLGISKAGKCQRQIYDELVSGVVMSDFHHAMCYIGYLFERDALARLVEMRLAKGAAIELVCPKDARIRGHVDGVTLEGDLLEIKSVTTKKFERVCHGGKPLWEHVDQVQLYMRYGGWRTAWILYICRETFEHKVMRVGYDQERAARLEGKLLDVLAAVERQEPPVCECGWCGKDVRR